VKLLFDQNLSPRLVTRLADLFPDSAHVHPLGIAQATDKVVREFAGREGLLVVTKDADFSELCLMLGFPPKVVWLRRGNCQTRDIEDIIRRHHRDIEALNADNLVGVLTLF
jgi:predicted nuclease of predicted toxin-antitoxin system